MSYRAEVVGRPRDGEVITLPGEPHVPVIFAIHPPSYWAKDVAVGPRSPAFRKISITPTKTAIGWRLYWPKDSG